MLRKGEKVLFSTKRTCPAAGEVTFSGFRISVHRIDGPWLIARARFIEYTTSAAVTVPPVWKVTPGRRVKVKVLPSAEALHLLAIPGFSEPSVATPIRPSYRFTAAMYWV